MSDAKRQRKDLFEQWVEAGEVENNLAIIQSLSMQGKSMEEIADVFDITRRTLQKLQKEHPALGKGNQGGAPVCCGDVPKQVNGAGVQWGHDRYHLCAQSLRR